MSLAQLSPQRNLVETSTASETLPCESVDGVPVDWSGRGTSHVDYQKDDTVPLVEGRYLGYGVHGGVYETNSNGVRLAWKRKYVQRRLGHRERREIDIIKRLSHPHVIRLIGTYTRGPILGLLLWPVATCDLAALLEDGDWLRRQKDIANGRDPHTYMSRYHQDHEYDHDPTFQSLGLANGDDRKIMENTIGYLEKTIGCISSAVSYLHQSGIKHKDLKPSNILLSADGIWVTDFGSATDFSVLTSSVTDNGERGTPKYFAPEVANYDPSGSASDIFAMGCVFLEIITLCMGYSLDVTQKLRARRDRSFQANLEDIVHWFDTEENLSRRPADEHMVGLIRHMMRPNPRDRPKAPHVEEQIALIGGLARATGGSEFCRPCCGLGMFTPAPSNPPLMPELSKDFKISWGNTYSDTSTIGWYQVTYFIEVAIPDIVEKVHMYVHQSFDHTHAIQEEPSFRYTTRIYGSFELSAYVVLRKGWIWDHPTAQRVPNEADRRMLPLVWSLVLEEGGGQIDSTVTAIKLGAGSQTHLFIRWNACMIVSANAACTTAWLSSFSCVPMYSVCSYPLRVGITPL